MDFGLEADDEIITRVPYGAITGPIKLVSPLGVGASPKDVKVKPTVTRFSPTKGKPGKEVALFGKAFTGIPDNTFKVLSYKKILAHVPKGAVTGKIAVTTPGGTGTSKKDFIVP